MSSRKGDALLLLSRCALGGLLLYAGLTKVANPLAFSADVANYQILPDDLLLLVALYLPWLELLLGCLLVAGWLTRSTGLLAGLLSIGFAGAVGSAVVRGLNVDCGCFSGDSKVGWSHVGLNVLMLGLSLVALRWGGGNHSLDARWSADEIPIRRGQILLLAGLFVGNFGYLLWQARTVPQSPAQDGSVSLVFDEGSLNFGVIMQGQDVTQTVLYRNTGAQPLEIIKVDASCSCTVPQPSKLRLAPGEEGEMTITYHPGANQGPIQQTVRVHLAGRTDPVSFDISAVVEPIVAFVPQLLELKVGETQRFRMESRQTGLVFKVTNVGIPFPELDLKFLGYPEPGVAEFEAGLSGPAPAPPGNATVWSVPIETDIPQMPPFNVYLRGAAQ